MTRRFNNHAPIRPTYHPETGEPLLYRTFPIIQKRMPRFMAQPNQICQMRLYRALYRDEYPNNAAASEVREWIGATHTILGSTILNAVQYEARKMLNRKAIGKPVVIYAFKNLLEFQYGLEWQICTWLRTFLTIRDALEISYSGPEAAAYELEKMAEMPIGEYLTEYEEPLGSSLMSSKFLAKQLNTDWAQLTKGLVEFSPPIEAPKPRTPPKSIALSPKV